MLNKRKKCPGKDTLNRINYLYQASQLMAERCTALSSYYGQQCKAIGRKSVLKM